VVQRRTALTALLAVLAVLALGFSAATLDSATTTTDSGGIGVGSTQDQTGGGSSADSGVDLSETDGSQTNLSFSICVDVLRTPGVQLLLLGLVGLLYLAVHRTVGSVLLSAMTTLSLLFPFAFVYLLLVSCSQTPTEASISLARSAVNQTGLTSGGGSAGTGASGEALTSPTALLGLLLVAAIVGSVALLVYSTRDDEDDLAEEPPEPPDHADPAAVGEVAGRAADRLEADADVGNEVYRAWREMTIHLDVSRPRSSTPAEFAAAAVDAGMDRADVTELTEVFEEVRYGGADPTPERERRAREALRNIEERYADTDGGDSE
jgi:hypothetical protein